MKFLVAVDGSVNAEVAFNAAHSQMDPETDIMYIISVAEFLIFYSGYTAQPVMDMNKHAEKAARRLLIKYGHEAARRKIKYCSILGLGDPREVICQAVKEKKIDILVLGRKGLSKLERLFVGSVSEHCVNNADCSVYVVKFDEKRKVRAALGGGMESISIGEQTEGITSAKEFMDKLEVSSIVTLGRVFIVNSSDFIDVAFKTLTSNNIHSVPVYSNEKGCFVGSIDMVDVMNHALAVLSKSDLETGTDKILAEERFLGRTCGDLAEDAAKRNPYVPIEKSTKLCVAVEVMCSSHLHRLHIVDSLKSTSKTSIQGVLSQSCLLSAFLGHLSLFKLGDSTIGELHLGTKPVIIVTKSQVVKDAFELMQKHHITGVGVVDDTGVLIGNVSATDFRVLSYSNNVFGYLYLTIENFLGLLPERDLPGPLAIKESATVEEMLMKFADAHVNRLFLVDNDAKPIAIITQSDVIKLLANCAQISS